MGEILFPFVYWAQDEKNVFLRVDLRNVESPDLSIRDKRLIFEAVGEGAKGRNQYNFALDFFAPISAEDSVYKLTQRGVEFTLRKQPGKHDETQKVSQNREAWWPRLTFTPQRCSWLKVDFEKWKDPDAEDSEDEYSRKMRCFDVNGFEDYGGRMTADKLADALTRSRVDHFSPPPISTASLTQIYLVTFNGAMFVGYLLILCQLIRGYSQDGFDYFPRVWSEISPKMACCQLAQMFEIFHSLVGYVKSSWKAPLLQVSGRSMVLFLILMPEPRLHDKPFIFYLFAAWSLIEVIRYPYYILAVFNTSIGFITWLRYTMWIPLYPLGILCEAVIIIRALVYYDETGKFTLSLPNPWNVAFDYALFLRFYLIAIFLPGVIYLLHHMRRQRVAKLCSTKKTVNKRKTQ